MKIIYLTKNSVSVMDSKFSLSGASDGAKAYQNSTRGRAQLEAECPEYIAQSVYAVWGDIPTVTEPVIPKPPAPQPSETDKLKSQLAYVQSAFAAMQALS